MTQQQQSQPAAQATATESKPTDQGKLLDQVVARTEARIRVGADGSLDYENFEGLWRIANLIWKGKLYPKGLDTPEAITIAVAMGRSVGLDPFQAVQNTAVINGRPVMWGDVPLAVCRQHAEWDESGFDEWFEEDGKRLDNFPDTFTDKTAFVCQTLRRGAASPKRRRFTVKDAKTAKLWGKEGPWTFYPARMLMFRGRGYCLRDNFGDALKGLGIKELVEDDFEEARPAFPKGRVNLREPATGNGHADPGPAADASKNEATATTPTPGPSLAPTEEQSQMAVADLLSDLEEALTKASTPLELGEVFANASRNEKWLGEHFQPFIEKCQEKRRALEQPAGQRLSRAERARAI